MRDIVAAIGAFWAALLGFVIVLVVITGLSWAGYLAYLHFVEGPAITQHAQNVRHSLNFVQAANQRAENAIAEFETDAASGDAVHANADRLQACSAANTITTAEMQPDVLAFVTAHCGASQ